jgi:hypothetical protein
MLISSVNGEGLAYMFILSNLITKELLESFCRKHHIRKLSLFGSALRDEMNPESDIDLLVEFDPDHIPGLLHLSGMEIELSQMAGRKVDLRTPGELSRFFREEVLAHSRLEYAA